MSHRYLASDVRSKGGIAALLLQTREECEGGFGAGKERVLRQSGLFQERTIPKNRGANIRSLMEYNQFNRQPKTVKELKALPQKRGRNGRKRDLPALTQVSCKVVSDHAMWSADYNVRVTNVLFDKKDHEFKQSQRTIFKNRKHARGVAWVQHLAAFQMIDAIRKARRRILLRRGCLALSHIQLKAAWRTLAAKPEPLPPLHVGLCVKTVMGYHLRCWARFNARTRAADTLRNQLCDYTHVKRMASAWVLLMSVLHKKKTATMTTTTNHREDEMAPGAAGQQWSLGGLEKRAFVTYQEPAVLHPRPHPVPHYCPGNAPVTDVVHLDPQPPRGAAAVAAVGDASGRIYKGWGGGGGGGGRGVPEGGGQEEAQEEEDEKEVRRKRGDAVTVMSKDGACAWKAGKILAVDEKARQLLVRYDNSDRKHDEWLDEDSERLGAKADPADGGRELFRASFDRADEKRDAREHARAARTVKIY
jgi:hypothetical protein